MRAQAIATLLSHYWVGIEHAELRKRLLADWLGDLAPFSDANVLTACDEWRRTQHRRPTPADIIALCREADQRYQPAPVYYALPAPSQEAVREDWRHLPISAWTLAERQIANSEMLGFARQRGYSTGNDAEDRLAYSKAAALRKHEGYDVATGTEKWLHKLTFAETEIDLTKSNTNIELSVKTVPDQDGLMKQALANLGLS